MEIRPAFQDEVFDIEACLVKAWEEMDVDIPGYERPYVYHNFLDQIAAGLLIVASEGGRVVGVVALAVHHWPWCRKTRFLTNDHFYVLPEHREGGTAKKLLDAAKAKADAMGMPLRIDLMGGGARQVKDRFMEMQGFRYLGGQFLYEGSR